MSELFIGRKSTNSMNFLPYSTQTSESMDEESEQALQQDVDMENLIQNPTSMELEGSSELESSLSDKYWAQTTKETLVEGKSQIEPMDISLEDIEDMSCTDDKKHEKIGQSQINNLSVPLSQPILHEMPLELSENIGSQIEKVDNIGVDERGERTFSEGNCTPNQFIQGKYRNPLFKRLYRCIQPAASKLQDFTSKRSTKRVELLVRLVPKSIFYDPDNTQFHSLLIKHIHSLLQEREKVFNEKDWITQESMSSKNLLVSGTLSNALCRRLDQAVIHIFAEIVSIVDRNCNLDLIDPRNENISISKFWFRMFANTDVMQFNFAEFVRRDDPLPGTGARKFGSEYECQFPFSWLVFDVFQGLWNNVRSKDGSDIMQKIKHLSEVVEHTPIGGILQTVEEYYIDDFYLKYLHDFVCIIHPCVDSEFKIRQYELISESLDSLLRNEELCNIDGNFSLIDRIASLHAVYHNHQSQIVWFGQLVMHNPGAIIKLRNEDVREKSEMVLHLCALDRTLECLSLNLDKDDEAVHLIPWVHDIQISQNIITAITEIPSHCNLSMRIRLKQKWHVIKVLQLFLEHILLNHPQIPVFYLRRLQLVLQDKADFTQASTLRTVQKHLMILEKKVKTKEYVEVTQMNSFLKSCCQYFMEVVSTLCFGHESFPEPELIEMLMDVIFTESKTRDLAPPFKTIKNDKKPTIRSSLLQLLLDYDSTDTKIHLEKYFNNSNQVLSKENDHHLCLLCIQCFEDALHKSFFFKDFQNRAGDIHIILNKAYNVFRREHKQKLSIAYLEAVAAIKFGLHVIAHLLHSQCCGSESSSELVLELFYLGREICLDPAVNATDASYGKDILGPGIYLVKLLVREFGSASLMKVSSIHKWIIPESLKFFNQVKAPDPFVVYNRSLKYTPIRTDIKDAYMGKHLDLLEQKHKDLTTKETTMMLLSLYQTVTMDYCTHNKSFMDDDLRTAFDQYIRNLKPLTVHMRQAARCFLTNDQGGTLAQMRMTEELPLSCKTLSAVVVHASAVILCNSNYPILLPFVNMILNPATLTDAYLPSMAEDPLFEARKAGGGAFYTCPNGHVYYVGECGKPVMESACNVCKARVGGQSHRLRADNRNARTNNTTQTGHDLGDPSSRTGALGSERYLSPSAICIVRAIMHSAFLWCSCHYDEFIGDLTRIVKPFVQPQYLPEFFWRHLEQDIKQLSIATHRSIDDAILLVHLVLKDLLTKDPPTDGTISTMNSLSNTNARQEWERIFSGHYISPVLENIQQVLNEAVDNIAKDDKQGHDLLFYIVHEKVKVHSEGLGPHLWTYRQKISLEHLRFTLKEETLKKSYPILHVFLQVEPKLRATQYLPHIVKLQQSLFDKFNYRVDKAMAVSWSVKKFLQSLQNENTRNEYSQWIESLRKAWELVGQDLKNHGRMPVKDDVWIPAIGMNTPIEYLIPTTSNAGVCTTALVDFLTLTHNDFIERCQSLLAGERKETKLLKNEIPITHIHQCHVLNYEHQITSVVISHCHYSLKMGEAHTVKYDYQSLQRHILDKFIHGKPIILSDIPQVIFKKDIHSTATFVAIRTKVKPQRRLQAKVQKEVLAELRTPDALQTNLDVIDTILGFLSSGGGKPNKSLGTYVEKVLKMEKKLLSKKAQECCQLRHILSLWETLSVELARLTLLREQEPFSSMNEELLVALKEDQKTALDECLRIFDLSRLLGALYEFIETSLRFFPQDQLRYTLVDVLVQDVYESLDIPKEFEDSFPGDITISQAVAVWKHIVYYQETQKEI